MLKLFVITCLVTKTNGLVEKSFKIPKLKVKNSSNFSIQDLFICGTSTKWIVSHANKYVYVRNKTGLLSQLPIK